MFKLFYIVSSVLFFGFLNFCLSIFHLSPWVSPPLGASKDGFVSLGELTWGAQENVCQLSKQTNVVNSRNLTFYLNVSVFILLFDFLICHYCENKHIYAYLFFP